MRTLSIVAVLAVLLAAVPFTGHADEESPIHLSAEFRDTDIRHVIDFIAKAGHANVIVSPKVKGEITLSLKSVPWRAALEQVTATVGGAVFEEKHGILRILAKGEYDTMTVNGERIHVPRVSKPTVVRLKKSKAGATLAELTPYAGRRNVLDEIEKRRAEIDQHRKALAELEKARAEAAKKAAELQREVAGLRKAYDEVKDSDVAGRGATDWKRKLRLAAARIKEAEALLQQQLGGERPVKQADRNLSKQILEWKVFSKHVEDEIATRGEHGPTRVQRDAIGRLDEGSRRLLERLHAERARISGRVVGPDGKPLARGVNVLTTDAKGHFKLEGLRAPGRFEWEQAAKGEGGGRVVWVGKDGEKRSALLIGRTDADGRVVYEVIDAEKGVKYVALDFGKKVDGKKQGHFVVHGLKPGEYELELKKDAEGRYIVRTKPKKPTRVKIEEQGRGTVWKESIGIAGGAGTGTGRRGGSRRVPAGSTAAKKAKDVYAERVEKDRHDRVLVDKVGYVVAARALKRAQDLQAAAKHLEAAGDKEGAAGLYRRAREAYEAAKRQGEPRGDDGNLLHAVNALRRDVGQLRGEVRELTQLVRELLGRRRPNVGMGLPGSGGRGGGAGGRSR